MAEIPTSPPAPTDVASELQHGEPAERGTLDVKTKAIQHIAERAVRETPGTVVHHSALNKLVGGSSPKANIIMEGKRARVEVDVAAVWPCNVTEIATDVRDRVLSEAARLSGVDIRTVDVTIHMIDASDTDDHERRRVQ